MIIARKFVRRIIKLLYRRMLVRFNLIGLIRVSTRDFRVFESDLMKNRLVVMC